MRENGFFVARSRLLEAQHEVLAAVRGVGVGVGVGGGGGGRVRRVLRRGVLGGLRGAEEEDG